VSIDEAKNFKKCVYLLYNNYSKRPQYSLISAKNRDHTVKVFDYDEALDSAIKSVSK